MIFDEKIKKDYHSSDVLSLHLFIIFMIGGWFVLFQMQLVLG